MTSGVSPSPWRARAIPYRIVPMNDAPSTQLSATAKFRTMHASGCFVLPNPWDTGTAVYLRHLGYEALATTSAGFAFAQGLPDTASAINRDDMLAHISK